MDQKNQLLRSVFQGLRADLNGFVIFERTTERFTDPKPVHYIQGSSLFVYRSFLYPVSLNGFPQGHSTSQTTGIGGHMASLFIPTVERESIDLV